MAQILSQGVACALVPVAGFIGLLGSQYFDKPAMERVHLVSVRHVPVKADALVLRQNEDAGDAAIDAVAHRHVDQSVLACQRHSRNAAR